MCSLCWRLRFALLLFHAHPCSLLALTPPTFEVLRQYLHRELNPISPCMFRMKKCRNTKGHPFKSLCDSHVLTSSTKCKCSLFLWRSTEIPVEVFPASNLSTFFHNDKWWESLREGGNYLSIQLIVSVEGWEGRMLIHLKQNFNMAKIFDIFLILIIFCILVSKLKAKSLPKDVSSDKTMWLLLFFTLNLIDYLSHFQFVLHTVAW